MSADVAHWQQVYEERDPAEVSWYEPQPEASLALIHAAEIDRDTPIVDVGGGASRLAAELLAAGQRDLTVVDISAQALAQARAELGKHAAEVKWVEADVRDHDFDRRFGLWHDRAVFHFMVDDGDRDAYVATLKRSLRPKGHLVIATFGPQGPERCSGLPVRRYGADELEARLGSSFEALGSELRTHRTPSGNEQQFLYAHFRLGS